MCVNEFGLSGYIAKRDDKREDMVKTFLNEFTMVSKS